MISFGDTVRVRTTEETTGLGLARRVGTVTGETAPSVTRVSVVGEVRDDYALAVQFMGEREQVWVTPDLLEFVDHGAGQEVTVDGVDIKMIRNADGSWREEPFDNPRKRQKPWWRFW